MTSPLVFAIVVLVLLAAGFVWMVWKLLSSKELAYATPEWLESFSPATYRPMERLLAADDYRFLRSEAGYRPGMEAKLRAQRRRIFRKYLRSMTADFSRLHNTAKLMLVHSEQDRPDLAKALIVLRLSFSVTVLMAYGRLALDTMGLHATGFSVRPLIQSLEGLQSQLLAVSALPKAADA
jgi:hypothetical protein